MIARHIFNVVTLTLAAWFIAMWWIERTQRIEITKSVEVWIATTGVEQSDEIKRLHDKVANTKDHAADPYEAQINQLTEQSRGFYQMQEEQKNIGLYLRDHYRDEIALGHHTGRSLDSIIIGYLSRERKLTKEEKTA